MGTGGLIRAYANSVKTNLKNSELITYLETKEIIIQFPINKIKLVNEYLNYHYQNIKIKKTFNNELISYAFSLTTTEIPLLSLWTNNNAIKLIIYERKDS